MKTLEDMDKLTNEIEYLSEKHKKIVKSIIKTLEENDLTVL